MTAVKFCGMTRLVDVELAVDLGARYVGCIFAGGPRHRTWEQAAALFEAIPRGAPTERVGVFDEAAAGEGRLESGAAALRLDVVQLHGHASAGDLGARRGWERSQVWAVMRCAGGRLPADAAAVWTAADALLLDAHVVGALGGTGVALPWESLSAELAILRRDLRPGRLVLAGGLTPDNVGRAIALVHPDVVDVSSGVEHRPGIKDAGRMRAFVDAVRAADGSVT